jgi:flavodoxin
MKVCIVYESKYGNGKTCAEYLQSVISGKGHDTEILSIREIKPKLLPQADFYIFSAPTHIGGPPGKMKRFLKNLKCEEKEAKYALITTCVDLDTKALQKMKDILQPKGMMKISDGLKIKVTGMKGPLEEGYQKKLEEFATEILEY